MASAVSGVPQGRMLGPLKFLFALFRVEGASACKLRPFIIRSLLIRCVVGSGGLRRTRRLRLGQAGRRRLGGEMKTAGAGRGGRGRRLKVG